MYFALFGPVGAAELQRRLNPLRYHDSREIADKSARVSRLLRGIVTERRPPQLQQSPPEAATDEKPPPSLKAAAASSLLQL